MIVPLEIVQQWLQDNLGDGKPSSGSHGMNYTYNDFNLDNDREKKLYVNVSEQRAGQFIGYKSGKKGDFITLVKLFLRTSGIQPDCTRADAMKYLRKEYNLKYKDLINESQVDDGVERHIILGKGGILKDRERLLPEKTYRISQDDKFSIPYIKYLYVERFMPRQFVESCFYSHATEYGDAKVDFKKYVIIPYYNDRKLVYWSARRIDGKPFLPHFNSEDAGEHIFNIDTKAKNVVVCEGALDAGRFGDAGLATGRKDFTDKQFSMLLSANFNQIILVPDMETFEKGPKSMVENAKVLKRGNAKVLIFDWIQFLKDKNIKKVKDFNELRWKRKLAFTDIEKYASDDFRHIATRYKLYGGD